MREWNDEVVFLHRIVPGRTDRSYGIHVARLAGLPRETVARAKEVLELLGKVEVADALSGRVREIVAGGASAGATPATTSAVPATTAPTGTPPTSTLPTTSTGLGAPAAAPRKTASSPQLSLFTEYVEHPAVAELRAVDLNALTPLAAFDLLRRLAESARGA